MWLSAADHAMSTEPAGGLSRTSSSRRSHPGGRWLPRRSAACPSSINERNGVMVPQGDPEALAHAITAALRRDWNPTTLRESVPSLSWTDLGRTLHEALSRAVRAQARLDHFEVH